MPIFTPATVVSLPFPSFVFIFFLSGIILCVGYYYKINIEDLQSCSTAVVNNNEGTSYRPLFVTVIPSKNGVGLNFILKIRNTYFATAKAKVNKKTINLRCRMHRASMGRCKFRATLELVSIFDPNHVDFYSDSNLRIKPQHTKDHICGGYGEDLEARQMYRKFLKDQFQNGESDYQEIKQKSKILQLFKPTKTAALLGDDEQYKRTLTALKRKKNATSNQTRAIRKKFEHIENEANHPVDHYEDGIDFFYNKQFLYMLAGSVYCDETNLPGMRQLYILSVQVFSDDGTRSHLHIIACALLPDNSLETYTNMINYFKRAYHSMYHIELNPERIYCETDAGYRQVIRNELPNTPIITSLWHIEKHLLVHLSELCGHRTTSTIVKFIQKTINGLMLLDMSDKFIHRCALDYLESVRQLARADGTFSTQLDAENYIHYINYVEKTWFDPRKVHCVGRSSNYFNILLTGHPRCASHPSETINSILNNLMPNCHISQEWEIVVEKGRAGKGPCFLSKKANNFLKRNYFLTENATSEKPMSGISLDSIRWKIRSDFPLLFSLPTLEEAIENVFINRLKDLDIVDNGDQSSSSQRSAEIFFVHQHIAQSFLYNYNEYLPMYHNDIGHYQLLVGETAFKLGRADDPESAWVEWAAAHRNYPILIPPPNVEAMKLPADIVRNGVGSRKILAKHFETLKLDNN